jgi:uncharacterized protein YcbX
LYLKMIAGSTTGSGPASGPIARGRVQLLARWPVKSLSGESLSATRLDKRGFAGDRADAFFELRVDGTTLRRLTARQAPQMLLWTATYPSLPDDALIPSTPAACAVTSPLGRRFSSGDPALAHALGADLGRRVELRRDPAGQQDLPGSVLVTTEASRKALEAELGEPVDVRRFRTNIHLDLDLGPFAEEGLEGTRLRVGEAELELLHPCERCVIPARHPETTEKWPQLVRHLFREHAGLFGINARAKGPGRIAVGDEAEVLTTPAGGP